MKNKRGSSAVDWNKEMENTVSVVWKSVWRVLSWILNILCTILLIGLITGAIVGGAFALYIKNYVDASVDNIVIGSAANQSLTTKILYVNENGEYVEQESERLYASANRIWVPWSSDDPAQDSINGGTHHYLRDAFIAIEDKRFWKHSGVDWYRTAGCTLRYFLGQGMQGGSTITQQLIKNVTGEDETTIQRKVQEILRALNLEKKYDKTEILEAYMNTAYLSQGCYGVSSAAYTYFGKNVKDLTLIESAAIASITQNPSNWDPIRHPDRNQKRRDEVIQSMYDQGLITKAEYDEAYGKELVLNVSGDEDESTMNIRSYYTDSAQQEAIELLMEKFGWPSNVASSMLLTNGYQIVTAQDPEVQKIVETYYANDSNFEKVDNSFIQPQSSCVIIDPSTGNVLGIAGARGKKTLNRGLNYATQTLRAPGSSIKPIAVYGPALQAGLITWGSVTDDSPVNFGDEKTKDDGTIEYSRPNGYPQNYNKKYRGLTTTHYAITNSLNTVSYKTLMKLGLENSYNFLENIGISSLVSEKTNSAGNVFSDKAYAPLALGQLTDGASVLDMTAAYSIFANDGVYNSPRFVLKILDSEGNVVVDNEKKSKIVLSEQNATIMTKFMQEVVSSGTANKMQLKKYVNVAGKTGTTMYDYDRWFIGYTPYYVCGVWFGYSQQRSLEKFKTSPSPALQAWDDVMIALHQKYIDESKANGTAMKTFHSAAGIVEATYCMDSGMLATDACRADPRGSRIEVGYFADGTQPTKYCTCHVMVDYDTVTGGIATPGCTTTKKVGLLNIERSFPFQVKIADAQYVYKELPDGYSYDGLTAGDPYFKNSIPEGTFVGITDGAIQYNHVCTVHIGNIPDPGVDPDLDPDNNITNDVG